MESPMKDQRKQGRGKEIWRGERVLLPLAIVPISDDETKIRAISLPHLSDLLSTFPTNGRQPDLSPLLLQCLSHIDDPYARLNSSSWVVRKGQRVESYLRKVLLKAGCISGVGETRKERFQESHDLPSTTKA